MVLLCPAAPGQTAKVIELRWLTRAWKFERPDGPLRKSNQFCANLRCIDSKASGIDDRRNSQLQMRAHGDSVQAVRFAYTRWCDRLHDVRQQKPRPSCGRRNDRTDAWCAKHGESARSGIVFEMAVGSGDQPGGDAGHPCSCHREQRIAQAEQRCLPTISTEPFRSIEPALLRDCDECSARHRCAGTEFSVLYETQ